MSGCGANYHLKPSGRKGQRRNKLNIAGAVRIESSDASPGNAVHLCKIATNDNSFVGSQSDCVNRSICAGAGVKARVNNAIRAEAANTSTGHTRDGTEGSSDQNLPIQLQSERIDCAVGASRIERC